jgi:glycosyltransferase involved in cell wall biosynthesis
MARNLAAAKSQGEILLFLDDDVVIPNRKFISRHVANYRDAKISSVTGRELHADQAETDAVPADGALPGRPSEEDTPLWSTKPAVFHALFFDRNSALRYEVATFCTCNGSIRRSEFLRVGGFDENFSGNSYGDDYDLAVRLSEAHGKLVYDPQAALIHLQAPLGGLRLKDPRNTFSEKDKALSACLFFLRHSRKGCRWHLLYHHLFRKTVLLRRNLTHFWSQPLIWCGITAAWLEARRRLRHGPISCFRVAAP